MRDAATGRRRDVLLGEHDTPASHAEYARVVQEWKDAGRVLDATPTPDALTPPDKSVARLLLDYIAAEQKRYGVRPEDRQPSNIVSIKVALRRCRRIAGGMDARAFGPRALTEVRDAMVAEGLAATLQEFRHPSHEQFLVDGKWTAWTLMNASTEALNGRSLDALPHRTRAMHGVLDVACGLD